MTTRTRSSKGGSSGSTLDADLIWVTEAMVAYGHSRGWFNRRIATGDLETVPQPGTTKVYLRRSQIEQVIREEEGQTK